MRIWGIDLSPSYFFQEEYITKYPRDKEIKSSIYEMNKLLLSHAGHKVSEVYGKDELIPFNQHLNYLIDCQAINLLHHYKNLQHLVDYSIVDYSSLGHRYVTFSDFIPFNHFLRAIKRSYIFSRKYEVSELWNWRMPWEKNEIPFTSIFWKNSFLDQELLISKCTSFMLENFCRFPEFDGLDTDSNILLVCPHTENNFQEFFSDFNFLLDSDVKALKIFQKADRILVKQHRISEFVYPVTFNLKGKKVIVINTTFSRILPSEILLLGLKNISLFSTISSIIFAAGDKNLITLGGMSKRDSKDYGFMLGRSKKYWKNLQYRVHSEKYTY